MKISWTKLATKPDPTHGFPCARSSHGLSYWNGALFLYGGEHVARTPLTHGAFWKLDLVSLTWTCLPATLPARVGHAQAVFRNAIYVFGGRAGIAMQEQAMDDVWRYSEDGSWQRVDTQNAPEARSFHRMIELNGNLYVFGGCGSLSGRLADLHRLEGTHWHALPQSDLRGRGGANLLALGSKLAVIAGFAGEETNDGQIFDPELNTWSNLDLNGLRPRSVCVSGSFPSLGVAVVVGGEVDPSERGHEGAGGFSNDVVVLDENGSILKTIQKSGDMWPEERGWADAAAVECESKCYLYLFGGLSGDDSSPRRLDDIWRMEIEL